MKEEYVAKKIFQEIMAENFPSLAKEIYKFQKLS